MKLKQYILIEAYLIKFKYRLQYPRHEKKLQVKEYRKIIYNALEVGETIENMKDINDLFGTPDDNARKFMELMLDSEIELLRKERNRKMIFIIFVIFLLLILIIFSIYVRYLNRGNQFHDGVSTISTSLYDENI